MSEGPPLIQLLGSPSAVLDGQVTALPPEAPLWLLSFLVCQEEPVARSEVMALLYPGVDEQAARNRLRNLLHRIRQSNWGAGLHADAAGLRWAADADVRVFRRACQSGHWAGALAAHAGPLLHGLRPPELPEFSEWLDAERSDLETAWLDAALHHSAELEGGGQAGAALALLEQVLSLSPYAEEAVQAALRCAVLCQDLGEATRVYRRFQSRLKQDLGLQPGTATTQLYQELERGVQHPAPAAPRPLPTRPGTPVLLGRENELAWMWARLQEEDSRLLTLIGPGGAGKTRLSLEALRLAQGLPGTRAVFVALEAVTDPAALPSALAQALGLGAAGPQNLHEQVTGVLQATPHLLVLDNLEQLLTPGGRWALLELLQALLDAAPTLRLVVTSRVRLGLQSEWLISLGGLDYPQDARLEPASRSGAVRLFVERAGRVQPGFALNAHNVHDLIRICQLTEGLPLALELTAAWMGSFGPAELVAELNGNLDLLESDAPDRPERHRSLRAAFLHSWRLLDSGEQQLLARLSVFRGGFERSAAAAVGAAAVGAAGLRSLLRLADHSLLRRGPTGRSWLHEVVRQYAAEELAGSGQQAQAREAHARWYAALAQETAPLLHGPQQAALLDRLQTEHDNLRAALDWTLTRGSAQQALVFAAALHWFWYVRGHHREGLDWLEAALARPGGSAQARAAVLSRAGGLSGQLGAYAQALDYFQQALTLVQGTDPLLEAEVLHGLGLIHRELNDLDAARRTLERAEQLHRALNEPWALGTTLNDLGVVLAMQGDPRQAHGLFSASLELKRRAGDVQGVAYALANLGNVTDDLQEYRRLTEQSLDLKRGLNDWQGVANSLYNLADLHIGAGDPGSARPLLEEALQLFRQLGRMQRVAAALVEFAKLAAAEGDHLRCLWLAGAADALLSRLGLSGPAQPFSVGPGLDAARAASGAQGEREYLKGATTPLDAALDFALALQTPQS